MERIVSENEGGGSQINHILLQPQLWQDEGLGFSGRASSIYSSDDGLILQSTHNNIGGSHLSHQLPYSSTDAFEVFSNYCRSLDDFVPCLDAAKVSTLSEVTPKPPSIQATSATNQSPTLNLGNNSSASCKKQTTSKRRKMQEKRIICVPLSKGTGRHNGSEGHSSDIYAWRKYGQKPIKGSPYPRGYYRCSSCKGCSARKQVEISKNDPSMVTITYTADHNHPDHSSTTHAHASTQGQTITSGGKLMSKPGQEEEAATLSEAFQTLDCSIGSSSTSCMLMDPLAVDAVTVKRESHADMKMSDNIPIANYLSTSQELEEFFAELEELPESSTSFGRATIKGEPLEGEGKYESVMTSLDPCSNHVVWSSSCSSSSHKMVNT